MGIFQGAQELGSGERAHGQGYYVQGDSRVRPWIATEL